MRSILTLKKNFSKEKKSIYQIYFMILGKITFITNFLAFFLLLFFNFSLLDPVPHIECRSGFGSMRENECGSTALLSTI